MATTVARIAFYAFLIWVPIPLGSNRPVFWAINAGVVLVIFLVLFLGGRARLPSTARRTLTLLIVPSLVLVAWMLIQAMPWTPDSLHHPAWSEFGVAADGAISANPGGTFTAALQFLTVALAGIIAARLSMSGRRSFGVLRAIIASASVVAVWGLVAVAIDSPPSLFGETGNEGGLVTSFFINRNTAATFLAIGLVAALAVVLMRVRASDGSGGRMAAIADLPRLVGPMLAVVVLLGVALVATGSRAGVIAGTLGTLVTFLVGWRSRAWIPQAVIGVALLVIGGAVLLFGTSSDTLFQRLGDLEISEEPRWEVYRDTMHAILDRPILGHGAGTFADFYPLYHGTETPSTGIWLQAHNTYLQAAAELGLPVFAAAVIVVLLFVVLCFRAARRRSEPATLAAVGAAVVVAVHSFFDFSLQIEAVAILFAATLGSGVAVAALKRTHASQGHAASPERQYESYGVLPESLS